MKEFLKKLWRYGRWVLLVLVIAYILLVFYRTGVLIEQDKSAEAVKAIHAQTVSRDLVLWKGLPDAPDPATDDATVAGIDANSNGIRDDAELTIFLWHKDSAKIRAAELQYAQALQSELTQVFSIETWIAVTQEKDRGLSCLDDVTDGDYAKSDLLQTEIKKLVLDTDLRRNKYNEVESYRTSYALSDNSYCDVDLSTLPN